MLRWHQAIIMSIPEKMTCPLKMGNVDFVIGSCCVIAVDDVALLEDIFIA